MKKLKKYLSDTQQDKGKSEKKVLGAGEKTKKGVIFATANEGNEQGREGMGLRTYIEIMECDVARKLKQ